MYLCSKNRCNMHSKIAVVCEESLRPVVEYFFAENGLETREM